jgi:hypothetical protein
MLVKISEKIITRNSVNGLYLAPRHPPIDRDTILTRIIDLEYEFQLYLFAAFKSFNSQISQAEFESGGIFSEPNMLSSLSKCLKLAKTLNLIDTDELHDLRKLVILRNMYAHGRHRREFHEDADAIAVMLSMKIYLNNEESLIKLRKGKALFCCIEHLAVIIESKKSERTNWASDIRDRPSEVNTEASGLNERHPK